MAAAGDGGFGYDPLFVPDGYAQTFSELGAAVKDRISHRARALAAMAAFLEARPNWLGER
jgi:XTP/dITP diphosphohydrolase